MAPSAGVTDSSSAAATGDHAVDSVLIYDGECPYCTVAARAMEHARGVGSVSWYDDAARAFLRAQFPDHGERGSEGEGDVVPFAMFLVDPGESRVYGGRAAARELVARAGLPAVGAAVGDNYETIAGVVGALSGRDREAAPYHETYPLRAAASERYGALAAVAEPGRPAE